MQEINYDLSNLVEFAAGDENFIREMLEFFVTDSPLVLKNLKNAAESADYEDIYQISHKFSSQLSLVEIKEVSILMSEIEHLAAVKADIEIISNRINEAANICLAAITRLKEDFEL